mgnify:CR=1 FL=1
MGLTFHYSGSFKKDASLHELIGEVKDIAEINDWEYHIYDHDLPPDDYGKEIFNDRIYGISFNPTGSEPVWLCFLSNGRLSTPDLLQFYGNPENEADRKHLYLVSTKTQYSGMTTHKIIITLLKYIEKKYLTGLKVYDEGQYWETGDEKLLEDIFKRFNTAVDIFGTAVENNEKMPDETYEDYFKRILKGKSNG